VRSKHPRNVTGIPIKFLNFQKTKNNEGPHPGTHLDIGTDEGPFAARVQLGPIVTMLKFVTAAAAVRAAAAAPVRIPRITTDVLLFTTLRRLGCLHFNCLIGPAFQTTAGPGSLRQSVRLTLKL
jgi:hypothetical protein